MKIMDARTQCSGGEAMTLAELKALDAALREAGDA